MTSNGWRKAVSLVPVHKWFFRPISRSLACSLTSSCSKNNARNITYMPALIFIAFLDLERKSSFLDIHSRRWTLLAT